MTDLRKAAVKALHALEDPNKDKHVANTADAIAALRQALAQPEQEKMCVSCGKPTMHMGDKCYGCCQIAQPKQEHKPWVSLTEEEIESIVDANTEDDAGFDIFCYGHGVARAVIDKLKEKNT
jgi:hypothetical protein